MIYELVEDAVKGDHFEPVATTFKEDHKEFLLDKIGDILYLLIASYPIWGIPYYIITHW